VLFGSDLDLDRYDAVIKACALKADLDMLPGGDMTEIGEKVNHHICQAYFLIVLLENHKGFGLQYVYPDKNETLLHKN